MASAAQERANRLNAARSSGPRTEAGKQKTKFNATRHGLTSRQVVLFSEDKEDYEELRRQFYEDHKPVGKTEEALVDEIAQCWWRLQRVHARIGSSQLFIVGRAHDPFELVRFDVKPERAGQSRMGKEFRPKIAQTHSSQRRRPAAVGQAIAMKDIGDFLGPALMGLKRGAAHLHKIPDRQADHSGKAEGQKHQRIKSAAFHRLVHEFILRPCKKQLI